MRAKTSLAVCLSSQLLATIASAATNPPALEFMSVPPLGSNSDLVGRVLNVTPANFGVAVYIYVAGGWYNKPYSDARRMTSIQSTGSWICDITTGGNDPQASRIAAFLLPSTSSAPLANGEFLLPAQLDQQAVASQIINRYPTELSFSGYKWEVKTSDGNLVGPGTNYFSSATNNVWVDSQDRLHLRITHQTNRWYCAEVISQRTFGTGTYRLSMDSRVDNLDPNVVLGFFTWSDDPAYTHREMDFEFSRFGIVNDVNNAQYVVQPFTLPGNVQRFQVPPGLNPSTFSFRWETNNISYLSMNGYYFAWPTNSIAFGSWGFTNVSRIPQPRDENARINLWLFNGSPPINGQETEVIINRFAFVPLQISSPKLTSAPRLTNGLYQVQLKGEPQVSYYLQNSTDFTNWTSRRLMSSPDGLSTYVDPVAATNRQRFFYRILVPTQ